MKKRYTQFNKGLEIRVCRLKSLQAGILAWFNHHKENMYDHKSIGMSCEMKGSNIMRG